MKLDLILFSRTKTRDYRYMIPLPAHCPEEISSFLEGQLAKLQSGNPDGTIHFFLTDTDAVLVRAIDSGAHDAYSRPILSLEGFYCPAEEIRTFWLCLPLIVPGFYAAPSLYPSVVQGETLHSVPVSKLLDSYMVRSQTAPDRNAVTKAMYDAQIPASFAYDNNGLHLTAPSNAARRRVWTPTEQRRCNLTLSLDKKQKTAYVEAVSDGAPVYSLLRSSEIAAEHTGWHIPSLEAAAEALEQQLSAHGWTVSDKRKGGEA